MTISKPASQLIVDQQKKAKKELPFSDEKDFDLALRGRKGSINPNIIKNDSGVTVWDNDSYNFLKGDSPNTANPSLWRQSQLTRIDGLFEVTPNIYQVRGFDLSNTTIVEGQKGIIVIDPLTSKETAAAAYALYQNFRGKDRPIKAIVYTHSHGDHFGGVKGFVSEEDVEKNKIEIIAPEGFLEKAVSENVYAGTCMSRRAAYMYGAALPRRPTSQIGAGLGQTNSTGTITLIQPNVTITTTGQKHTVDGVEMNFQMAPNTEAPSEVLIYFPGSKALCAAEDAVHTFHNLLTLRGALVRDPHVWSKYLTEAIDLFGDKSDVVFASHHWPTWGQEEVNKFLTSQRDLYAYVHDQTLRLINKGYNGPEIAEMMTLPPAIDKTWSTRGYYGSTNHNVKAIYQRYCGWFDGNPAHLWEHTPTDRAKRYVDLVGGAEAMVRKGREAAETGDLRWAAELLNHVVFAYPYYKLGTDLLADVYEQLGYGAENGTWRNFYMSGAFELRKGNFGTPTATASPDVLAQLPPEMVFDSMAIQVNGPQAWNLKVAMDVVVTDAVTDDDDGKEKAEKSKAMTWRLWLSNGALVYSSAAQKGKVGLKLTGTRKQLPALVIYRLDPDALKKAGIKIEGSDVAMLKSLASVLDPGDPGFNIVTP